MVLKERAVNAAESIVTALNKKASDQRSCNNRDKRPSQSLRSTPLTSIVTTDSKQRRTAQRSKALSSRPDIERYAAKAKGACKKQEPDFPQVCLQTNTSLPPEASVASEVNDPAIVKVWKFNACAVFKVLPAFDIPGEDRPGLR